MNELKALIAQHPFLRGITPEYLEILAASARAIEFAAGQPILSQQGAAYELYLIMDGKVAIESHLPTGDDLPLQVIGGGDVLGWSWLFPPFTSRFQARALQPSKAIFLDGARLLVDCENDHGLGYELLKRTAQVVITRLQATRKRLVQLHASDGPLAAVDETKTLRLESQDGAAKPLVAQLAEHPFLNGMNSQHLGILAEAAMQARFPAGELIFNEGDIANRFYLLQHGKVVLQFPQTGQRTVPVEIIGDGDVLGWSWLFPPFCWHFSARALEPTQGVFLYGTRLREYCEENHDLGYDLMKRITRVLVHRLQITLRQLLEISRSRKGATAKAVAPL